MRGTTINTNLSSLVSIPPHEKAKNSRQSSNPSHSHKAANMFAISKMMLLVCLVAALNCATIGYDASMMSSLNILVGLLYAFFKSSC